MRSDCSSARVAVLQIPNSVFLTSERKNGIYHNDASEASAPEPPGWDNGAAPVCSFLAMTLEDTR